MKTKLQILKLLILLCSVFTTTFVFGQTTYTWTGAGDGASYGNATNWDPMGIPMGCVPGDIAQWDGRTTTNLFITCNITGFICDPFGPVGLSFLLTANQTNSVQIISPVALSSSLSLFGITNNSSNAPFILGNGSANVLSITMRPAGATHDWVNNSTNPTVIYPNVRWQAGGGAIYTLIFDGTGNWIVTNGLNNSGVGTVLAKQGTGTLTWAGPSIPNAMGFSPISSPFTIGGGTVVLAWADTFLNNVAIANNGALLKYDAPAQSQTLNGVISGTGALQVNNGTLTLGGQNTYCGTNILSGGVLVVNSAENPGFFGPLGVTNTIWFNGGTLGFSVNDVYDYSSRFSTAAGQAYSIDTGGQSVTFATGLTSSGGSLTKFGAGTLTLAGANTYSGATTVSAGKLMFQGPKSGFGNITVADGAALGITATGTQVTPGTLTLGTSSGCTMEFNNVNSTTTAPLAAATLSPAGTITVNINSGTFTVGQSYPLLIWATTGSAPSVSLGALNGALGNLAIVGNAVKLNITGLVAPPTLIFTNLGNSIQFSWTGAFKLQSQTNGLNVGLGTNWADYSGGSTSPVTVLMDALNESVCFRLVSTP